VTIGGPTGEQIRALHERYAPTPEAFALVYTHCQIVCAVAEQLADSFGLPIDIELIRAGSLLHDIGVYLLYDDAGALDSRNYIRHGILGYDLLRGLGLPDAVCRFCAHHTGVGLDREDVRRQSLPLPVGDYLADSDEELLVMYADKFHSKSSPPTFLTASTYRERIRAFGEDKAVRFTAMVDRFGEPDLTELAARHGHPVR